MPTEVVITGASRAIGRATAVAVLTAATAVGFVRMHGRRLRE